MPNYTKLEEQLLGPAERELTTQSRAPVLGTLDDAAIYQLIAGLAAAQATSTTPAGTEGRSGADLLAAALRRVHAERRKRGLKPQADAATKGVSKAAAKPAGAAKRVPASPARKPAGRAKAEARKNDVRTGSRLVSKLRAKTDDAAEASVAAAKLVVASPLAEAAAPANADDVSRRKLVKGAARKAAIKATKAAEKDARKIARKAAKDAEKAAEKAARKAAKKAVKDADKAARKAEKAGSPAKGKKAKAKPEKPEA